MIRMSLLKIRAEIPMDRLSQGTLYYLICGAVATKTHKGLPANTTHYILHRIFTLAY
jgi:hypothetical protein